MIFRLLLFFSGLGMKTVLLAAGFRSPEFKHTLSQKQFTLQIRTRDKATQKTWVFRNGGVVSQKIEGVPDFLIEWSDSNTALKSLLKFKPGAIIIAVSDALLAGNLKVEYDVASTAWMATTMKGLPPALLKGNKQK